MRPTDAAGLAYGCMQHKHTREVYACKGINKCELKSAEEVR